uniref:OSJNBb0115I21.7 protein n=1 Tax=Oryza sativa subsp. japonica TaxID=39947 RepID=Q7XM64_ORYSJ|nr:OSJNBb0115I21.7 [Oryza sativa Japonica Group]
MAVLTRTTLIAFFWLGDSKWTLIDSKLEYPVTCVVHCRDSFVAIGSLGEISMFSGNNTDGVALLTASPSLLMPPPAHICQRSYLDMNNKMHLVSTILRVSSLKEISIFSGSNSDGVAPLTASPLLLVLPFAHIYQHSYLDMNGERYLFNGCHFACDQLDKNSWCSKVEDVEDTSFFVSNISISNWNRVYLYEPMLCHQDQEDTNDRHLQMVDITDIRFASLQPHHSCPCISPDTNVTFYPAMTRGGPRIGPQF